MGKNIPQISPPKRKSSKTAQKLELVELEEKTSPRKQIQIPSPISKFKHNFSLNFLNRTVSRLPFYSSRLNQQEGDEEHFCMNLIADSDKRRITQKNKEVQKKEKLPSDAMMNSIRFSLNKLQKLDQVSKRNRSQMLSTGALPKLFNRGIN